MKKGEGKLSTQMHRNISCQAKAFGCDQRVDVSVARPSDCGGQSGTQASMLGCIDTSTSRSTLWINPEASGSPLRISDLLDVPDLHIT